MDIRTDNPRAVGSIFGEDIAQGPQRAAPEILAQFLKDWPMHSDAVLRLGLAPPPRCPVASFGVTLHRVDIVIDGKLAGHALRMDDISLSTLAAFELAWSNHRRLHAH